MLKFTRPFPAVLPHRSDEPAYALLLRNGIHNGIRLTNHLFDLAGDTERRRVSRLRAEQIAWICKAEPDAVKRATPVADAETVKLFDVEISAADYSVAHRRWCPMCLKEDPYHRVWWDVQAITTCPAHEIELVSDCGCGKPLRWRNQPLVQCDHAHDLRRAKVRKADAAATAHDTYFLGRLLPERTIPVPALDGVSLREVSTLLERLGQAWVGEGRTLHRLRRELPPRALQAEGFRIATALPGAFEDLLDRRVADAARRKGKGGVAHAYGHEFYYWIAGLPDHSLAAALKSILARHVEQNVELKTGTRLPSGAAIVPEGVTVSDACRRVGMGYDRFVKLLLDLGIEPRPMLGGARLTLSTSQWSDLHARLDGWRNLRQVCSELGVWEAEAIELAREGWLEVAAEGRGSAEWVFARDASAKLLGRLRERCGRFVGGDWRYEPLHKAVRAEGASVAEAISLVMAKRLPAKLRGRLASGLISILVPRPQLRDLLAAKRGAPVPLRVAGRRLGIGQAVLDAVLREGMLAPTGVGDVETVSEGQIAGFRKSYATMAELRELARARNFQVVAAALTKAGVRPSASGPSLFDAVYPRAPATAVARDLSGRVAAIVESERPHRTRKHVAADLMMRPLMLRQLVEAGFLRMREGCPFGSIPHEEIEAFRARYATIPELTKKFGHIGVRTVVGILNKAGVEPRCRPPEFPAMLYDRASAEAALQAEQDTGRRGAQAAKAADVEPHLTVEEAVVELGAARNMVLQLAAAGILPAQKGRGYLIPKSAIVKFKQDYVLGNELAQMVGRDEARGAGKAVTEKLIAAGLKPVCARPQFYSYLFRRSEAAAMIGILRLRL